MFVERMAGMAGRPRKDPDGLVAMNFAVPGALKQAVRDGARDHGLSMVDYIAALVAIERNNESLGPALQRGLDFALSNEEARLRDTA